MHCPLKEKCVEGGGLLISTAFLSDAGCLLEAHAIMGSYAIVFCYIVPFYIIHGLVHNLLLVLCYLIGSTWISIRCYAMYHQLLL